MKFSKITCRDGHLIAAVVHGDREDLDKLLAELHVNPWCGVCGNSRTQWNFDSRDVTAKELAEEMKSHLGEWTTRANLNASQ